MNGRDWALFFSTKESSYDGKHNVYKMKEEEQEKTIKMAVSIPEASKISKQRWIPHFSANLGQIQCCRWEHLGSNRAASSISPKSNSVYTPNCDELTTRLKNFKHLSLAGMMLLHALRRFYRHQIGLRNRNFSACVFPEHSRQPSK